MTLEVEPMTPPSETEEQAKVIAEVWDRVVKVVNKLISTHESYGFVKFCEGMHPTLDVVLKAFNIVEAALKTLMESGQLDTDEYRQVVNSRQCIYHTRRLALALDSNDETEYQRLIDVLKQQSPL